MAKDYGLICGISSSQNSNHYDTKDSSRNLEYEEPLE